MGNLLVTAPWHGGKTTRLRQLAAQETGPCFGFLSIGGKNKSFYTLLSLATGRQYLSLADCPPGLRLGRYYVREEAFASAQAELLDSLQQAVGHATVFLDEIGRLEFSMGLGFDGLLRTLLRNERIELVLAVRDEFMPAVIAAYGLSGWSVEQVVPWNGTEKLML
ncbi:MAG: hypothetical protein LKE40_03155 [Spirochaetia bacterium]|jgi:nucleoside-triphosphatase THEP1|nr:hypothetical protein [Spirochaetia bacterium]